MLSYEELLAQVKQLPSQNRLALIEEVVHSLREELPDKKEEVAAPDDARTHSPLDRLYGILKSEGVPQTDEEIQSEYTDYLAKKYS
jgi:hypothetical protein